MGNIKITENFESLHLFETFSGCTCFCSELSQKQLRCHFQIYVSKCRRLAPTHSVKEKHCFSQKTNKRLVVHTTGPTSSSVELINAYWKWRGQICSFLAWLLPIETANPTLSGFVYVVFFFYLLQWEIDHEEILSLVAHIISPLRP